MADLLTLPSISTGTKMDRLLQAKRILLATDFDGTLSPLEGVAHSKCHPVAVVALHRLAKIPRVHLALVSGRRGLDLCSLSSDLPECWKISDHGRSCRDPQGKLLADWPSHAGTGPLHRAWLQAETFLHSHPVDVEHKRFSVVVHLPQAMSPACTMALDGWVKICRSFGLEIVQGRGFVEAIVPGFDKRRALLRLSAHLKCDFRIFAGDDVSDLSTLAELSARPDGLSIFVCSPDYPEPGVRVDGKVQDPEDWAGWLMELSEVLS